MSENKELLEVKDLGITFFTDRGALPAVQEVSFSIKPGETLGVVGAVSYTHLRAHET